MNLFKYILPLVFVVALFSAPTYANTSSLTHKLNNLGCDKDDISHFDNELSERDWEALHNYISSKRCISLADKAHNLVIAGDVRAEWRHQNERRDGDNIRGNKNRLLGDGTGPRNSRNDFDIEFNLYFDYCCDRAWAVAQLQFDNSAGVMPGKDNWCDDDLDDLVVDGTNEMYNEDDAGWKGSGSGCGLNLKKAYIGYNICCDCDTRFDIELGRRRLYHVFDSQVQFLSQFDGLLFKYSSSWDCYGDWYWNIAGFVVDEKSNHFAWVTEFGMYNICDSGFDFKYSFIDWKKRGHNRCWKDDGDQNESDTHNPKGSDFQISQWTVHYHFDPEFLCMPANLYAAFLYNHSPPNKSIEKK